MPFDPPFTLPLRLGAFYFAFFAYSAAYVAYFPLYLAWRGLSAGEIAFVLALPQIARIFAPAGWGWLADRAGAQRGIVILGCAMMAACFMLLPYCEGTRQIAAVIAATSVVSACALPLVEAMALGAPGGLGRYGPIRLWGSVGFVAVVLAGGAALDVMAIARLSDALVLFALASLAAAVGLPRGSRHASPQPMKMSVPPAARAVLAAGFCMAAAHGALYAFLTIHLQREGYSGTAIGALWTLGVLAEILVFAYLPALFRRHRLSAILMASFLCAVARFLVIGWAASALWLLVLAQLAHAATFGSFHAASVAAVHRAFPPEAQARGQALFSSLSYGAGGAAGALFAGWAWESGGPGLAFSLAALAAAAGLYFAKALQRAGL